jgi:hypothetical protein
VRIPGENGRPTPVSAHHPKNPNGDSNPAETSLEKKRAGAVFQINTERLRRPHGLGQRGWSCPGGDGARGRYR